jgi:hypothetical protein
MNVFSEWMNQERHQQTMVAQSWFLFDLLEKSRIICHSDTNSLLEYPEPRVIVCTHKTMNSCLELSNLYNHFLCLVADSDTRDVPISQFSDCQFILYKDVMQYSSLEQLDSFLRSLQPKYLINSKVKGQITLDVSLNLTISNQVSFSN